MGAPLAVVVFGVRAHYDARVDNEEEVDELLNAWRKRASAAGLECWNSRVEEEGPQSHVFFIGDVIAKVGPEYSLFEETPPDDLFARCRAIGQKLAKTGFVDDFGAPSLWTHWIADF